MNLLLVDDEIAMLHIMEKAIDWKKKGIQKVFTAYNTDLARDIISSSKIDLVICDIEMPKENGLSLIQWIQDMYPEIINIILTGYPDFNYARSAISLGVYRYLLKPIAFDELEETIASAVEKLEEYKTKNKPEADPEIADAVNTIKKYLESHYSEVITRKKIEELVHLNQDHINREFKTKLLLPFSFSFMLPPVFFDGFILPHFHFSLNFNPDPFYNKNDLSFCFRTAQRQILRRQQHRTKVKQEIVHPI